MFLKPNSFKDVFFHLLAAIGLGSAIVLFIFYIFLPNKIDVGEITVPNLEGRSLEEVEKYLSERNLRYEINSDSGYNDTFEPLAVLSQFPVEGTKVKEKRLIYLTLNTKLPPIVKMPRLVDLSLKSAIMKLNSIGLEVGKKTYTPDPAHNAILKQKFEGEKIEPGTEIHKGSIIDLEIGDGLGNSKMKMPDLMGMAFDDAQTYIEGSGLKLGLVTEEENTENFDEETPEGTVTRQVPKPEESVRVGEVIDLWVKDLKKFEAQLEAESNDR